MLFFDMMSIFNMTGVNTFFIRRWGETYGDIGKRLDCFKKCDVKITSCQNIVNGMQTSQF